MMVLAPADMARLTHFIKYIKNMFSREQPSLSADAAPTYYELALLYKVLGN
jgi:hypothetical protein